MEEENKKQVRDDSDDSELDSPEVKRLRDDLLGFLDDSDPDTVDVLDLDSVMKSFEEEISASSSPVPLVDLISDSGESWSERDNLPEASNDELCLTLPVSSTSEEDKSNIKLIRVSLDSSGIGELWGYGDDQIPNYDAFELESGEILESSYGNTEYVAYDGLFEHSDVCFESLDYSDFSWRQETLPATVGGKEM